MTSPTATWAVLFASDGPPDDLLSLPGILKLSALVAGVLAPVIAASWGLAVRTQRSQVRGAERLASLWRAQAEHGVPS